MADLTVTATQVSPVNEFEYEAWTLRAAETIAKGQAVAIDTSGYAELADADTGGDNNFRGVALNSATAGNPVTVMVHGSVAGFDLSGVAYDGVVYLSDTPGALGDAAGTVSIVVGRCKPMHDGATPNKVLYVNVPAIM